MEQRSLTTRDHRDAPTDDLAPLLLSAARGEAQAWRELVARYSRRVFALAKSRCRNDDVAEEITQSVFATVASKLGAGEYTERGRFESWLFRVAMNRVRDHLRRSRRKPETSDSEALDRRPAAEAAAFPTGMVDQLRAAMRVLSDADREVIELRHHGGLSFKQISEVLDEPMGTLLARHHRALRKLKDTMELSAVDRGQESLT
jgi:RNA polymerase sigma-70 factor (ECF subfamily)